MTILEAADDQIVTHPHGLAPAAAAAIAAMAAAVAVYLNALNNPFVYDDYHTVVNNTSLERLSDLRAIVMHDVTRPIVNLSYAIDRQLFGRGSLGFHRTNLALHALNVLLLFVLARRLYSEVRLKADTTYAAADTRYVASGFSRTPVATHVASGFSRTSTPTLMAFAAALLFAVHPMMTEAVGYVSGRSELLCGVFF